MAGSARRGSVQVRQDQQALPGFEMEVMSRAERDMADIGADTSQHTFTAETLKMRYPGKYMLAARAFFEKNRSAEAICDILKISPQTMHALVESESIARGFSSVKARIRAKSMSVALKAATKLERMLDDAEQVEKAGIAGLAKAVTALTGKELESQNSQNLTKPSREDSDCIEAYCEINGFGQEKNPARVMELAEIQRAEPSIQNAEEMGETNEPIRTTETMEIHFREGGN